ncbi:hypothetical protein [Trichothermofontia sp.]
MLLTRDFPDQGLHQGDLGAVVYSYPHGAAFNGLAIVIPGDL